jgi:hypothetical protein
MAVVITNMEVKTVYRQDSDLVFMDPVGDGDGVPEWRKMLNPATGQEEWIQLGTSSACLTESVIPVSQSTTPPLPELAEG